MVTLHTNCYFITYSKIYSHINTLRPRQNGRHFADDLFKSIFFNENVWISIKFSLNLIPKGPIDNNPALVQLMAWHRAGDKPLSEPMLVMLLTHICVTWPQWVHSTKWKPLKACRMPRLWQIKWFDLQPRTPYVHLEFIKASVTVQNL